MHHPLITNAIFWLLMRSLQTVTVMAVMITVLVVVAILVLALIIVPSVCLCKYCRRKNCLRRRKRKTRADSFMSQSLVPWPKTEEEEDYFDDTI